MPLNSRRSLGDTLPCFLPTEKERLERGWPHQVILEDDSAAPPERLALTVARGKTHVHGVWPREALHRYLRLMDCVGFEGMAVRVLSRKAEAALRTAGPPSAAEATAWLARAVHSYVHHDHARARELVFAIEALIGADRTLETVVRGFEAAPLTVDRRGAMFYQPSFKFGIATALPFVMLRASRKVAKASLRRLADEAKRFAGAGTKHVDLKWVATALAIASGGAAAVQTHFGKDMRQVFYLDYCADDPAWVRERLAANPRLPCTVRTLWIAGPAAMSGLSARKFSSPDLIATMRDVGMLQSPETVDFALSLVGRSAAKDAPLAWLASHAAYARPILLRAAKGNGPRADVAKAVLARLG